MKNEKIIDDIEKVRSKNNVNWMDIVRLAYKHAPQETIKILKNIKKADKEINNLMDELK